MRLKGKRGVEDYTNISITGVKSNGQESLSKVRVKKLLASAKPDELYPEVKVKRERHTHTDRQTDRQTHRVSASSKGKLNRVCHLHRGDQLTIALRNMAVMSAVYKR